MDNSYTFLSKNVKYSNDKQFLKLTWLLELSYHEGDWKTNITDVK